MFTISQQLITFLTRMEKVTLLLVLSFVTYGLALIKFNPGNTLRDCRPAASCANCYGYSSRYSFRTLDGTCNNLRKRTQGAAMTALTRFIPAHYIDRRGLDTPRGFPYPYFYSNQNVPPANKVSQTVFEVINKNKNNSRGLAVIFMTFGQFLDHDISLTPHGSCSKTDCSFSSAFKYPCFPIKFNNVGCNCTGFARSIAVCQTGAIRRKTRNQINLLSSYIDGSQIYGTSLVQNRKLRKLDGSGEMSVTKKNLLPIEKLSSDPTCGNAAGCSLVGDVRGDENIALNAMHTIWVRQHNLIAKQLKAKNRRWSDHRVFETARKIVGGILQRIVYNEFLPNLFTLRKYKGYRQYADASIANGFSTAGYRFGHSLVPQTFSMLDKHFEELIKPEPIQRTFFNTTLIREMGVEPIMLGAIANFSQEVDIKFSAAVSRKLFIKMNDAHGFRDLTALNIQRGRDHGIPTYGKWRKACKLSVPRTFRQLKGIMPQKVINNLKKIFKSPYDIDLFAAGMAENHKHGERLGPTFSCILKLQFQRLRDGDRFYYERKGIFTPFQLREIKKMTLAKVLCNTLKGVVSIQRNVFQAFYFDNKRVDCSNIPNLNISPWVKNRHGK